MCVMMKPLMQKKIGTPKNSVLTPAIVKPVW